MSAGKRDVSRRMPVLREYDVGKTLRERVDDGNDLVTARDRQRAARSVDSGAEVVLQIDHQQRVGGGVELHALSLARD